MTDNQRFILPITTLIEGRLRELSLTRVGLARRAGYTNISKALRRIEHLCEGEFRSTRGLIHALPLALEIPADLVKQAVEDSKRQIADAEEAAWRATFVPHAIILTERATPEPIFVAAFIGVDRLIRLDLDLSESPVSFVGQALEGVRRRLAEWNGRSLPAFGRPIGIIVNYSPDHAVRFDLQGRPVMAYERAYRPGMASLSIRGRPVTEGQWAALRQTR